MNKQYISPAIEACHGFEIDRYIMETSSNIGGNNLGNTGQEIGGEFDGGDPFNGGWE